MATSTSTEPWLISVKTLGGFFKDDGMDGESCATNKDGEKQFTVSVSPEDGLSSLHAKIEASTGLKACQQRLIYRGRIISANGGDDAPDTKPKLKDIAGLSNGQTIHLVKKREVETPAEESPTSPDTSSSAIAARSSLANDIFSGSSGGSGSGGGSGGSGSLLAALLGLGSMSDDNEERDTTRQRWGWRSGRRSRRPHYRLTADDLEVPDPGSMEPVRQGLMTMHTLLPHSSLTDLNSPLEANREWYRGQWIDCRDTVNQWLEATVVEIVDPDDILPQRQHPATETPASSARRRRREPRVDNDPAVGANDFDARQRLLLEVCESGDLEEEEGELVGFRRRDNNEGVQLLLIHYNGWPHRWDEWIRSDSERIRPFRTRTRHQVSSLVSPTPQSIYTEAPRTNIVDGSEADDRAALLPELSRALNQVNELLQQVVQNSSTATESPGEVPTSSDLPWVYQQPPQSAQEEDTAIPELINPEAPEDSTEDTNIVVPLEAEDTEPSPTSNEVTNSQEQSNYNRRQLQNLAALLDRLGRTLSDAAPHVASLAHSLPEQEAMAIPTDEPEIGLLGSNPTDLDVQNQPPLGGLLSLWSRERRRNAQANQSSFEEEVTVVDPDHVDYANGLVNTSRGEVRSGPRSRSQNDDVSNLLGAYLAAASLSSIVGGEDGDNSEEGGTTSGLGRLLSTRGGGGGGNGGIDIHIHAVVTAPGVTPGGGIGIGALDNGTTGTALGTRNLFSSTARERSSRNASSILRNRSITPITPSADEDDEETLGLFSELYSENPEPVNPNGTPEPSPRRAVRSEISRAARSDESEFARRISTSDQLNDLLNDAYGISPSRRSRRSSSGSAPNSRQSSDRSERRSSGWGRLFRRRRSDRDRRGDP
mmetsp:Transcript_69378/g.104640  ORF Transcript_69378/g.104640 Transcript_69378/m.104640 type:complete len:879 (+) Transcript_69378:171-2807(+)